MTLSREVIANLCLTVAANLYSTYQSTCVLSAFRVTRDRWYLPAFLRHKHLEPRGNGQSGMKLLQCPGLPLDGSAPSCQAAAPTLIKQSHPFSPKQRNPDGVFNFDTKLSSLSLEIIYKESKQRNSVVAAARGDERNPTTWCGHEQ